MPPNVKIIGEGDADKCAAEVRTLFPSKGCTHESCSFNNIYQPAVRGKFFAFSGFAFVIKFLKFPTGGKNLTRTQVRTAVDTYCKENWSEVSQTIKPKEMKYAAEYCFDGHYVDKLLDGYGFKSSDSWTNIEFTNKIAGASASWAFGYVVDATGHIASTEPKIFLPKFGFIAGVTAMTSALLLTIISIIIFTTSKICKMFGRKTHKLDETV